MFIFKVCDNDIQSVDRFRSGIDYLRTFVIGRTSEDQSLSATHIQIGQL